MTGHITDSSNRRDLLENDNGTEFIRNGGIDYGAYNLWIGCFGYRKTPVVVVVVVRHGAGKLGRLMKGFWLVGRWSMNRFEVVVKREKELWGAACGLGGVALWKNQGLICSERFSPDVPKADLGSEPIRKIVLPFLQLIKICIQQQDKSYKP